ncbi:MAG: YhdP family protein [Luteimonas sp.]
MPMPLRHHLRRARRGAWYVIAGLLVAMALVAGVASQLLPLVERHPDKIAAWLSARAGRNVAFDKVETEWTRGGPLLRVEGLRVGDGAAAVPIGEAEILVSQYGGLLPGRSFTELRLRNLALTIERAADGRWSVRGLPGQQRAGGDPLASLQGLGELQVIGARLAIVAPSLDLNATVPNIDVRLRVDGNRVRVGARAWMRKDGAPLDAAMDFDRKLGDGRLYAGAKRADLSVWSPLLHFGGVSVQQGSGRAEAWAELRDHRVAVVTVDAVLDDVRLRGMPLPASTSDAATAGDAPELPHADFERVETRARWRVAAGGWRFDAPRLRVGAENRVQTLDGLLIEGGEHYGVLAKRIDAGPLFTVAGLSDSVAPGLRKLLAAASPRAVLRDVKIFGARNARVHATASVDSLGFKALGNGPGLSGLSGTIDADGDGFVFAFDPKTQMRFDWPQGFGIPHDVALRGRVAGWREGAGWRIETPALRVDGTGFGVDTRGGLWFQGDGTRPSIDLAVALDDNAITLAKQFWVRHSMPPGAIRWLDAALVSGRVEGGRAVISGDLDDWPFRHHEGLFQADARIVNTVLKFQPDWPATDRLDADVSFSGIGFTVTGKAAVAGVDIPLFRGGIADFAHSELLVRADLDSDVAKMLALLRQSPLQKQYGETLTQFAASGPAVATFGLTLPLHANPSPPKVIGDVELRGAKLSDSEWKLAFENVRGKLQYDRNGFDANDLSAVQEGQPGMLSLRAGAGHVRDRAQAFEAELLATFSADALLERAPQLAWLKPYVDGKSPWTVAVSIPSASGRAATAAPNRLQLRSTLIGTRLDLPAPLDKASATPLATTIDTALPLGTGDISVAFGDRMALRARSTSNQTGVRVVLGAQRVTEAPPASGLIATGRTDRLDAIDWAALTRGGGGVGASLPLRRIDVTAGRLQLIGATFANSRVRATPVAAGTAVQIDGDALSGSLILPDASGAAIAGRMQRLYWRSAKPAGGGNSTNAAGGTNTIANVAANAPGAQAPTQKDDIDPAAIPPLNLIVDDLRFGDAPFGNATLRARPIAGGMRIDQFQARAAKQRIDVSGDWTGRGINARTRLDAAIASEDFGALLSGFGFGGRIDGGKGTAKLNASWPGSPATFKVAGLEGTLSILAKEGRLVEVEPGAGRVLGLLSIAEIPRRLTLDFRDFFSKGFAFNRIEGNLRFAAGQARTDDLVIAGPAADISIHGAANLRVQTFDQTIEVLPKTGNLLTAVGAIAGGPVGAAVGAVANAVLRKPLGQLSAKTYRVTGPWKDPKVEVIGRTPNEPATSQPPAG